ncbi:IclR family transcriptional regulator [Advenella mimigardefordensis]|uniref:Transcriptional regulator, IclR family n=1 Tax=Advenella mimigardefordensis (strain DSM 17166 / LMG 22922 / DPN7) TaxID=1247726 RepID=W0PDA1_ADVMD|nr:IclR family transcriptional regulator [Advenella mimigardefordensis]AHG64716.1 transcriptional regulator, IclR family [Advenella mimigardefordensis DPN7]
MDKTLLKGLRLFEIICAQEDQPNTIDDLAISAGLTKSNTHRTLQTLMAAGYVEKSSHTGGYKPTLKVFELAAQRLARLDVRKIAAPLMRRVAQETQETVHLSVLDQFDVIYIDKIDSPNPVRAYSIIGGRAPAYAVATGKALLAFQSSDYLERHVPELLRHTENTITTLSALREELADISRIGYAINRGEWRNNVGGIAAPVFDGHNRVIAAFGISGPLERFTIENMKRWSPVVLDAAREISRESGYRRGYFGESD